MTLTKRNIPSTHAESVALLNGRESRNISHNGCIFRDGADVVLRLHNTNIVTFHADGSLNINTGGWHTRTTQAWINCALRGTGFAVWTVKGALAVHRNGAPSVYLDDAVSLAEAA